MKQQLLLLLAFIATTVALAQTTWTGAGTNTNWNNTDNWDTNLVPTVADDVIIPTGFTVTLNVAGSVKSIDLQGDSVFEMNTNFSFTEPSTFGENSTVFWNSGTLNGSSSTLAASGLINLGSNNSKIINGDTVVNNSGTINITTLGDLLITNGILNNEASGIIDMQANGGNISWSGGTTHILNNAGLIRRTTTDGEAQIIVLLNNNDGTISVESGILAFQDAIGKNFTDGTYNVSSGAVMDWDTIMTLSGNITGTIDGTLNWNSTVTVLNTEMATLNFSGSGTVNWSVGTLNGGGTLNNLGELNLISNGSKIINGNTVFNNLGAFNITSLGDLLITQGVFNNEASGVIDMQADGGNISWSGGTVHILNNFGLIKRTTTLGEAQIIAQLNNNGGTITVESGILSFQNVIGKNFTAGTYNVFAGATMDWDTTMNLEGTLTGTVDGNLNWNNIVTVANEDTATFNFTGTGAVNWVTGTLNGGGTLNNLIELNLISNGSKIISGDSTFNNSGTFNITTIGDLLISQGVFNNEASGVLDMQAAGGNISWSGGSVHIINNEGLIKRTSSIGEAQIVALLNNNGGTITVETGILSFQDTIGKNFTAGTYNVFAGAAMDWDTTMTLSGELVGLVDGELNWTNIVSVPVDASLNFTGSGSVNWRAGSLNGGGSLNNIGTINLTSNASKSIFGDSVFNNSGTLNITSVGDLLISQGVFNNEASGVLDMQSDGGNISWSGGTIHVLNNAGTIKRTTTTGQAQIDVETNNSGTIQVETGELEIASFLIFTNEVTGVVKGVSTFDLPVTSNYVNNGIFSPGLSPGTLSVQGDFESEATSQLEMELNGLAPDTEHDVLNIQGNADMNGSVAVIMGFEGDVGDAFVIVNTSGTINTQNLQSPIENVDFDGKRYTFEVSYPDNNKVVLTIIDKLDILPPDVLTQDITIQLDASGNASITTDQIDDGTTDNCTPTNELQFVLDVMDFTCADLGDNTVTLTVTDNDGNVGNAQATVTVEDNVLPTVVTQNITVELDASGNVSITTGDIDDGTSDNCSIASLSLDVTDFTCANLGENTVNLTVTDQSGNSDSAPATVTVEDNVLPTVITQNITVQLDASGNASITTGNIDDGSSDNCSIASLSLDVTDFTCANLGENTVNLTVTDQSGNSDSAPATVTVEDNVLPTVVTQSITVELDASGNASITTGDIDDGSSDNCSIASLSLDVTDFTCANLGENTVNLTVTDQSGNSDSAPATVTVEDNILPTISCPPGLVQNSIGAYVLPDYVLQGDVTADDNCGFTTIQTPSPGTSLPDGEYLIEVEVIDDFGNSTKCSFNLEVNDQTLGVDDNVLSDDEVSIYPNPASDRITIRNVGNNELTDLTIIDAKGSIITRIDLKDMRLEKVIDLHDLSSGVYFLRINSITSSIIKRMIKQ